jgi:hypothetical protein
MRARSSPGAKICSHPRATSSHAALERIDALTAVATRRTLPVGPSGVLRATYHAERQKNA